MELKGEWYENSGKWENCWISAKQLQSMWLRNNKTSISICDYCGWEADDLQNDEPDYIGGANVMSLNQYKQFWKDNKDDLLKHKSDLPFYAIKKAEQYFEKNFKQKDKNTKNTF